MSVYRSVSYIVTVLFRHVYACIGKQLQLLNCHRVTFWGRLFSLTHAFSTRFRIIGFTLFITIKNDNENKHNVAL